MSSANSEDLKLADVILEYAQGWCPRGLSDNVDGDESHIANTARELLRSYDIIKTGRILDSRGCERIALQFPDSLLEDSFFVSAALEECLRVLSSARDGSDPRTVFVLGDTSYGECCVDEVAAQHLDADVVVHYGNACLSPTRALPVLYVFPSHVLGVSVDVHLPLAEWVDEVVQAVPDAKRVVVLYDLELVHFVREIGGQNHPRAPPRQVAICVGEPRVRLSSIVEPLGDVSNQLRPAANNEGCCKETVNSKGDDESCCGMRENLGSESLRPRIGETTGHSERTTREIHLSDNDEMNNGSAYRASPAKTTCGPLIFPSATYESSRAGDELDSARQSPSSERQTAFLWLTSRSSDEESIQMRNAALRYSSDCAGFFGRKLRCETGANDGNAESMETVDVGRLLRRRYGLVEKVRDAERIAIVAGTLGVSGNLAIIDRCKEVVERAGRRWYVVVVGKPSAPKLANFAEMDAFVLVACPQNALIDSREHLRPVLTPLELEVAMGARDWFGGGYSTDFADLFATPLAEEGDGGAITGSPGSTDGSEHEHWQIASRGEWTVLSGGKHGASQFLKGREWQGLDPDRDAEGVAVDELDTEVVEGRSGRAAGYVDEG